MLKWRIEPTNALEEAVAVFGNVQAFAKFMGLTKARVYDWLELGYVPTREKALRLSEALLRRGHPISAARLMALDEGSDTERAGEGSRRRAHRGGRPFQKKGSTPRVTSLVERVDRSEPAVGQMRAVQRGGELGVLVRERPLDVLQGFAAAQQRRREAVAQAVGCQILRQAGNF